jgi:hypothetical protein
MLNELLWYGASVQLEENYSILWAYVELRARSQSDAEARIVRLFRDGIKIIYCQLI